MAMKFILKRTLADLAELAAIPLLIGFALYSRWCRKQIDVGLGPMPIISNVYHKRALQRFGYSAETFVNYTFYITEDFDHLLHRRYPQHRPIIHVLCFLFAARRYRCLYINFDGGPLSATRILWRLEGPLLKLARASTLLLPYGGDVQVMSRSPNLLFKHTYAEQYRAQLMRQREIAAKLDHWSRNATHIISGVEWVDYMYCWDTLMLSHFSIDTEDWQPVPLPGVESRTVRILHAPNHRSLKGTNYFVQAVNELRAEGYAVELELIEKVTNAEVRQRIAAADIVADQLVIGWYAMFAMEAMALGRPVLCHVRDDLLALHLAAGTLEPDELPLVRCDPTTVKAAIRDLLDNPERRRQYGDRGVDFVRRRHSLDAIGGTFDNINRQVGLVPSIPAVTGVGQTTDRSQPSAQPVVRWHFE
jgi:glycosyltransferase involved in cell wall biosynthesis